MNTGGTSRRVSGGRTPVPAVRLVSRKPTHAWCRRAAFALVLLALASPAAGQAPPSSGRPVIEPLRWKEDWSALADPALRARPGDRLKYVPLVPGDPESYVSFGARLRERFEVNDARLFGTGDVPNETTLLQRFQLHADIHLNERLRGFVQVEDAQAFGKEVIEPIDENPLDLRLGFVDYAHPVAGGTLTLRVGRQDLDVGEERFISGREGPNVRQSFDALWGDWSDGTWRVAGFFSHPTTHRFDGSFDDRFDDKMRFGVARAERRLGAAGRLIGYYGSFGNRNASFADAEGDERRHVLDLRWTGSLGAWDWNVETMLQAGEVSGSNVSAWAAGADVGYVFADAAMSPRLGLQADAASGDRRPGDGSLETFNPLFPSGTLFTLGDYTGYANLLHLKPSLTLEPADRVMLTAALGLQWRQTTADAVYAQPSIPIAGTAGHGDRWSGAYGQLRVDYAVRDDLRVSAELVRFEVGDTLQSVGGGDSTYLGVQIGADW